MILKLRLLERLGAEVKRILSQGKDALLIIDIQGAIKVKEIIPSAILIFLLPPSLEELKRRLINRAEKEWELRFKWAVEKELPCVKVSDYVVINDNLNKAVKEVASIIISNRLKTSYFLSKNLSLLSDEKIKEIKVDCDSDSLIYLVEPAGPACHTGERTCFHNSLKNG